MGRWIAVRIVAWVLVRDRMRKAEVREVLGRAFPRRDYEWREQLLGEAQARNAK